MTQLLRLEDGRYGRRAVPASGWSEEMTTCALDNHIAELELNSSKGWPGGDLNFLEMLPQLKWLRIIDFLCKSVVPIHCLHDLRALQVSTYCKTEIKFSEFPRLEECGLTWRPKASSLFECRSLVRVIVSRYSGRDLKPYAGLRDLRSLTVLNAPVEKIRGLDPLQNLQSLRLGDFKKLVSIDGIEVLSSLKVLSLDKCRGISSIEPIGSLPRLRVLDLSNLGDIETLKPLETLRELERVTFVESTNIVDGDLSPLLRLKNLSFVSFQNRRHYSHKREEFAALGAR